MLDPEGRFVGVGFPGLVDVPLEGFCGNGLDSVPFDGLTGFVGGFAEGFVGGLTDGFAGGFGFEADVEFRGLGTEEGLVP